MGGAEIGQKTATIMGAKVEILGFEGPPIGSVGRSPWSIPKPFQISTAKARALENDLGEAVGFGLPYGGHGLSTAVNQLADLNPSDWRAVFPQLAAYPWDLFDYEAEDRFLAAL